METDAVYLILEAVRSSVYGLIVSPVHFAEMRAPSHAEETSQVLSFLRVHGREADWDEGVIRERAEELHRGGFGPGDAAHLAFAERSADVFITCDDILIRRGKRLGIRIPIVGPVEFALKEGLG